MTLVDIGLAGSRPCVARAVDQDVVVATCGPEHAALGGREIPYRTGIPKGSQFNAKSTSW